MASDALSRLFPYANPQGASVEVSVEERDPTEHCYAASASATDGETRDEAANGGTIQGGVGVAAAVGSARAEADAFPNSLRVDVTVPHPADEMVGQADAFAFVQAANIYDFDSTSATFGLSGSASGFEEPGPSVFTGCLRLRINLGGIAGSDVVHGTLCRCVAGDTDCVDGLKGTGVLENYSGDPRNIVIDVPGLEPPVFFEASLDIRAEEGSRGNFRLQIPGALRQTEPPFRLRGCSM